MANEKRLIDANALKDKLLAHHNFFVNAWGSFSNLPVKYKARVDEITHCLFEIANAPTVDAVEVVHGRWEKYIDDDDDNACRCTACGWHITYEESTLEELGYNYCPNCGAKMGGEAK